MTRWILCTFLLLLTSMSARSDITFNILDGNANGVRPILLALKSAEIARGNNAAPWAWSTSLIDFDGDGKLDCYLVTHSTYGGYILKGNGDGTFASWPGQPDNRLLPSGATPKFFDIDGDGHVDIGHFDDETRKKAFRNVPPNFTQTTLALAGNYGEWYGNPATPVDLNADGKLDLKILRKGYGKTKQMVRTNQGNFVFTNPVTTDPAPQPAGMPANIVAELAARAADTSASNRYGGPLFWEGDLNGDGRSDVVIRYFAAYATSQTYIFGRYMLRNEAGVLEDKTPTFGLIGTPELPPRDLNGDGRLDILTTHTTGAGAFLQQADGTWVNSSAGVTAFVRVNVAYDYVSKSVDFDQDGQLDLVVSNSRAGVFKVYRGTGTTFAEVLSGKHWDGIPGFSVGDVNGDGLQDLVIGGPGPGAYDSNSKQADLNFTVYINTSVAPPPPPPPPPAVKIPLPPHDATSPQFARFRDAVDRSMTGTIYYGYASWHPALMYTLVKEDKYATEAIRLADTFVAAEEARIAAGQAPTFAGNQYLDVGRSVGGLAKVYDWCGHRMPASLKTRIESLCDQACFNVWNPPNASWGGNPHPWPGWSVNNPGNNYHFSFLQATTYWALAGARQPLIDLLNNEKFPAVVKYYRELPDGGSREGTGYGDAQQTLFEVVNVWRAAGQPDIPRNVPFFTRGLQYWIHATLPTLNRIALIGDQARDHYAMLFDYHRHLGEEAVQFSDPVTAGQGRWWLDAITPFQMTSAFMYPYELMSTVGIVMPPQDNYHFAPSLGHFFWRKSWTSDSPWLAFTAGPFLEAHASQDQGAFQLFRHQWLAAPANLQSTSGIMQGTPYQNVVRFSQRGTVIPQKRNQKPGYVTATATMNNVRYSADLSSFYTGIKWIRHLTFDGIRMIIDDDVEKQADVTAVWQAILPNQPTLDGNSAAVVGMKVDMPVPATAYDLRNEPVDPVVGNRFTGGWRLEYPLNSGLNRTVITLIP